jgi:hypothetical protein
MTAQVIAVDFGERRIPNGEYRCRISAAESDGRRIEWRMQAIDGPCHELRFSTATDDRDGELAELLEALGMNARRSKVTIDLSELVGRELIIFVQDGWFEYFKLSERVALAGWVLG